MTKHSNTTLPLLVTLPQACELLGIKRTTLCEFTRTKRIHLVKIGSRGVRVPMSELERFVSDELELAKKRDEA